MATHTQSKATGLAESGNGSRPAKSTAGQFLYRHCDLIAALLLVLILGLYFGLQRLPLQLNILDDFDFSFALDAVAKVGIGC